MAQSRTLLREIGKRQKRLAELQRQLGRWQSGKLRGKRPTIKGTKKKVDGWLAARHMKDLFQVEITEQNGLPKLKYRFMKQAWQRLERTLLGKTILFTDNNDWTDQKIAVHVFYCVLALTLCTLLRRELHRQGVDRSIEAMLEPSSQIREVAVVYPRKTKGDEPIVEMTTSQRSEDQRALYNALSLKRYSAG